MKRPNRYPYTRSQWAEEAVDHYTYKSDICYTSHILENRLTGEIIVESDGKTTTAILEIPDQSFYLEIAVKLKEEVE